MINDIQIEFVFWFTVFILGLAGLPLTRKLFRNWYDKGYLFSKTVGIILTAWLIYFFGTIHFLPFSIFSIILSAVIVFFIGLAADYRFGKKLNILKEFKEITPKETTVFLIEEIFFILAFFFWSWIKAHEPSIRGLEKFMDYGFMNSILHAKFFPPADMWYPPYSINYYYFGHLVTAMLTKLSGLSLTATFNLMLSLIFAFCFTSSFSIGYQILKKWVTGVPKWGKITGGILAGFLTSLAGNMQTIYAFTQGYDADNVVPFWKILWPINEFLVRLPNGLNRYWYANATRFIPYTIHEFPSYSFAVSDVHGHVLSIPFVLLAIALLVLVWGNIKEKEGYDLRFMVFYGFLCGILLMTNALDGPIYFGLFTIVLIFAGIKKWSDMGWLLELAKALGVALLAAVISSLPFMIFFRSFVNGVAVDCPPASLANTQIGPLLFEGIEKCQKSDFWMMWLLWGFFWFNGLFLFLGRLKLTGKKFLLKSPLRSFSLHLSEDEQILGIFFVFSLLLWIFPEFFYFKDIYPMHFRSNTMFKLGYQAFIMCSIMSAVVIIKYFFRMTAGRIVRIIFIVLLIPQLFLVSIYPIFSVRSYFNSLSHYEGVNGLGWMQREYPAEFAAINWLNHQPAGNIIEADGDSYTDFNMVSVFTGRPTVIGWAVHEWLWRGTYDVVSPRRNEVAIVYGPDNQTETKMILDKYHVRYIIVGTTERGKFETIDEAKIQELAKPVFTYGSTVIYEVNPWD